MYKKTQMSRFVDIKQQNAKTLNNLYYNSSIRGFLRYLEQFLQEGFFAKETSKKQRKFY